MTQQTDYEVVKQLVEKKAEKLREWDYPCFEGLKDCPPSMRNMFMNRAIQLLLLEENLAIMVEGDELEWACDADGKKYQTKVARPVLLAPFLKQLLEKIK